MLGDRHGHRTVYERLAPPAALVDAALAPSRHAIFWLEDAPGSSYAPLSADTTADLTVVGGGYCGLWTAVLAKRHGGRYIIRGKSAEILEGAGLEGRSVVILEFPTMDQLKAFVKGDEYQKTVKPLRAGTGIYDIGIFESPPPAMQ